VTSDKHVPTNARINTNAIFIRISRAELRCRYDIGLNCLPAGEVRRQFSCLIKFVAFQNSVVFRTMKTNTLVKN
jgi:hypothetical protein